MVNFPPFLLFGLLVVCILGIVFAFLKRQRKGQDEQQGDRSVLLLQQQLGQIHQMIDVKFAESHRMLQSQFETSTRMLHGQFGETAKIVRDVTERLAKLDETNRQVVGFADQLQHLQDVLKNPKQRGVLGEYFLETVLKNVLPPSAYALQYAFQNGDIVDAVVKVKEKLIPIDSKFSLENYNRILDERDPSAREQLEKIFKQDLKNRIDETAKYIRPNEGTMDFSFMFIPAEGIYYDLLINRVGAVKVNTADLIEYAFKEKRVIIVSPTSFFAYLQTVLQGLRALQIEESAKEIRTRVEMLARHLASYESFFQKHGTHLATAVNSYNAAQKEFGKIDKDVVKIADIHIQGERLELDKPDV